DRIVFFIFPTFVCVLFSDATGPLPLIVVRIRPVARQPSSGERAYLIRKCCGGQVSPAGIAFEIR
ncbi:hypothetical protein, partial [Rhizobium sp.]|uniref:hypothetical protein n=1 Tax=Rhizobium sp. TaxID=391 RepID=UPI0028A240F5